MLVPTEEHRGRRQVGLPAGLGTHELLARGYLQRAATDADDGTR
jgi:hypothetical protein